MNRTLTTAISAVLILTVLGSMMLVQTNSRSSILIKEAVYIAGAALMLLLGAASMILKSRTASDRISLPLIATFAALMVWMVFRHYSGIGSVNGPQYMFSVLSLSSIIFVMSLYMNNSSRDLILWVLVASSAVLSLYAILQSMGVIIFTWDAGITQSARSSGTMGNANLLGSFAMAMIPVGAGFLLSRGRLSRLRYAAAGLFALLCMGALLASKTRGSLIGLLALGVAVPFVPFIRRNRKRLAIVMVAILILLALSVLLLSSRMEELADVESGTLQVRQLIWSGTLSMWLSNPVLGYGPGSFQMVFPSFRDPEYFILGVSHNTLHAHCEYLEILVDTGAAGLLLWAILAFLVLRRVRRGWRDGSGEEDKVSGAPGVQWVNLGIAGGILALLAEALVSVALRWPPSALLLALLVGMLISTVPSAFRRTAGALRYAAAALMAAVALFLILVALPDYFRSMKAAKELFVGKDMYLTNIQAGIDNAVNYSMEWNNTGSTDAMERAIYYFHSSREVADSSVKWCQQCVRTDPDELGGWYALGSAYVSSARLYQQISPPLTAIMVNNGIDYQDPAVADSFMALSLVAYDSLRSRAPNYAEVHNNLTLVWISLGNPDSALAHMRVAWDMHAHNRRAYTGKVRILNPLTHSTDGTYLKWRINLISLERLMERERAPEANSRLFQRVLFDYGTAFYRFPDRRDSLWQSLQSTLRGYDHPEVRRIEDMLRTHLDHIDRGIELAEVLHRGDTAAVLEELEEMDPQLLESLPAHKALYGLIQSRRGSVRGMEMLCDIVDGIIWNGVDDMTDFPVGITDMISTLNTSLARSGLDSREERLVMYRHLINMLSLDRSLFEVLVFVETSLGSSGDTEIVTDDYRRIWQELGGPLFSFMESRDGEGGVPVMMEGSLLDSCYRTVTSLSSADSLGGDMIIMEIEWLFILFSSSYTDIPHYSNTQSAALVSMLADARNRLVEAVGESEAQYMLGWMFSRIEDDGLLNVSGEFGGYVEALRSDLTMGRITRPDLP